MPATRTFFGVAAALAAAALGTGAHAAYTLTLSELGGDVVGTGTGTLKLGGLSRDSKDDGQYDPFIEPSSATVFTGNGSAKFYFASLSGPSAWGTKFGPFSGAGSGDAVYLNAGGVIGVPTNYFSGALLNSSVNFASQTFVSLGLQRGTYAYTFGSGVNADTFTVQVGPVAETPSAPAVPEPATWAMLVVGLGAVGATMRRRDVVATMGACSRP